MNGIRVVFFDLGDTLWHFPAMPPVEVVRGETMRKVGGLVKSWGYEMSGERRMLGRDIRFAIEEETHRAFHGDCVDPGYPGICKRIAAAHGMEISDEQAADLWEAWNLGGVFLGRRLFPDVIPTLTTLRDRGFRLGVITNRGYSGPLFYEELDELGLTPFFECVAVSCEVGYSKPHPRIYQYALEAMAVEGTECAMVGDSLRADVEGARTLGLTAIWRRPHLGEPVEATEDEPGEGGPLAPDFAVSEIGELLDVPVLQRAGDA